MNIVKTFTFDDNGNLLSIGNEKIVW
jgi:hypothetical protein